MAYVGYTGVANLANTSNGFAISVVANNVDSFGDDVGDHGVIDQYGAITPPATLYYILMENSGYVLMEDGSKIQLES